MRHWTDHEDSGWKTGTDGFETVADRMVGRLGLEGDEEISWVGGCRKTEVFTKEIGSKAMRKEEWEKRIQETAMAGDYDSAFTDGSKLEDGKTGAGWTVRNQFYGGKGLGTTATVWDAEVTAIAETLSAARERGSSYSVIQKQQLQRWSKQAREGEEELKS